jgi:hypothetical protein
MMHHGVTLLSQHFHLPAELWTKIDSEIKAAKKAFDDRVSALDQLYHLAPYVQKFRYADRISILKWAVNIAPGDRTFGFVVGSYLNTMNCILAGSPAVIGLSPASGESYCEHLRELIDASIREESISIHT